MKKKILVLLVIIFYILGAALGYVSWIGPRRVFDELVRMLSGVM